ncbi:MAG: hypothetical protein EHM49_04535 [Deltaproteobacteria bacterium]|nr:MAG: hypothetical protein EHM49_04535 [Deltaproteobacteria bacterium]
MPAWKKALDKGDWPAIEADILRLARLMASEIMAACLSWHLDRDETRQQGKELAQKQGISVQGTRNVRVTLATGSKIIVRTTYALPQRSKQRDYRRLPGNRRPGVRGSYPVLERLGFVHRQSLLYCQEVAQAAVLCPSLDIADRLLSSRGIEITGKKICNVCVQIGKRMLRQRSTLSSSEDDRKRFRGARVIIGIDGGRLRTRKQKQGRRRKSTGHHGFHSRWREPKMFVIYTFDGKGRCRRDHLPIHDATLGNADAVFALLEKYMLEAGVVEAKEIVFVADGAHWIWDRIEILSHNLCIDRRKITQVVDFYHACEHISAALEAIPGLSDSKRKRLYRDLRSFLSQGQIQKVMQQIRCRMPGKKSLPDAEKELGYFERYQDHMRYRYFRRRKVPIGSGAIESAIRRVINLRLKAPGTFWREDTAEVFLYLRSQLVSGRWKLCFSNFHRTALAGYVCQQKRNAPQPPRKGPNSAQSDVTGKREPWSSWICQSKF